MTEKRDSRPNGVPRKAAKPKGIIVETHAERHAAGKALRQGCPRESHGAWKAPAGRPDPVHLVLEADKGRLPSLLPLRHGRMVHTPFTFYRGSALAMVADLASTPSTGVRVQCCGDAHLSNFGVFDIPGRKVIFSVNDLDETLPAPWEWDVKRLATSFVVASRNNRLSEAAATDSAITCVRSYRKSMAKFSQMTTLALWNHVLWADALVAGIKDHSLRLRAMKGLRKGAAQGVAQDLFPKLAEGGAGLPVIEDKLPTIFHAEGFPPGKIHKVVLDTLARYRATLPHAMQSLLGRYELLDAAMKVVGVGSVGTSCWVVLFMAGRDDLLFMQVKEARASVLEPYAGKSAFDNHGERVINGYRLMQPVSDMFLGWTEAAVEGRPHFYIRQLRDLKIEIPVESFRSSEMELYATWCAKALALSHARSGSSAQLSGYMGNSDAFDRAIGAFAIKYADQNEEDHAALKRAVRKGQVKAVVEKGK